MKPSTTQSDIQEALKIASTTATIEHGMAERHLGEASQHITRMAERLNRALTNFSQHGPLVNDLRVRGERLAGDLQLLLGERIAAAQADLSEKKGNLGKFTITLFGRTQAGKSTIREAITHGSGETIGKGAQRTTRDVRYYEWNHLTIVDTPGIAAYRGEDDANLAFAAVSSSDLILFLLSSDSVQEDEFEAMARLYAKNKPIVFVLNVKRDIENVPFLMKRALGDSKAIFDPELLEGCNQRIKTLAVDRLDIRDPKIIALHAQSAFLATLPQYNSDAHRLRGLSRLDQLEQLLISELTQRGAVRRLQTLYDGVVVTLDPIPEDFTSAIKEIKVNVSTLKRKLGELERWVEFYERELLGPRTNPSYSVDSRVRNEVREWLSPLRNSLPGIIDRHIDDSKLNGKINKEFEGLGLANKASGFVKALQEELKDKISELIRALEAEIPFMRLNMPDDFEHFGAFDGNRIFGRVAAGASVVGGVAMIAGAIAVADFWNPVGWVAAGVALVCGALSWWWGDHDDKRRKAVSKTLKKAMKNLDEIESSIVTDITKWFAIEVRQKAVNPAITDTKDFCEALDQVLHELGYGRRQLHEILAKMNRHLLSRSVSLFGGKLSEHDIALIARFPGNQMKFTHSARDFESHQIVPVQNLLNERICAISSRLDKATQIATALRPATIASKDVHIGDHEINVEVWPEEMGLALGKELKNHRLACRLFRSNIKLSKKERS